MIWTIITVLFLLSTLGQTTLLIQNKDYNHAVLTEEEKDTLIDIMHSTHSPIKLDTEETIHRQLNCLRQFDVSENNQEKGWGWSPPETTKCAAVGQQCTSDFRNISENNSDFLKHTKELEKGWGSPQGDVTIISFQNSTSTSCCKGDFCYNRRCCTPTPATTTHSSCNKDSDCCHNDQGKARCHTTTGLCLTTLGNNCNQSSECFEGTCQGGSCCLLPGSCQMTKCSADKECCGSDGKCIDGTCFASNGGSCVCDSHCIAPATCNDNICCSKSAICTHNPSICCPDYMCSDSGSGQAVCIHSMYRFLA